MALNDTQAHAVSIDDHCLITACPGSGKTTVLAHRAAYLLRANTKNWVLGVTFTADSAAELATRIRKLEPSASQRLLCGTFHSLCRRQIQKAGLKVRLINDHQQKDLMRRAMQDVGTSTMLGVKMYSFEEAVDLIESIKSSVDPMIPNPLLDPRVEVYQRYQELLRGMGAMDFADLLLLAVQGMRDGTVKPFAVTHMLVDEFQDTDDVQFAWMDAHRAAGVQITVVGDDDQSIYGFRNARGHAAMEQFRQTSNAVHVSLDMTYRCAQDILSKAAQMIIYNTERIPKSLRTANRATGEAQVHPYSPQDVKKTGDTRSEEFDAVIAAIRNSGEPSQWGILARTNALLADLDNYNAKTVPMYRPGGTSFWELRGPSLYLAMCRIFARQDMTSVDAILRRAGASEEALQELHSKYRTQSNGAFSRYLQDTSLNGGRSPAAVLRDHVLRLRPLLSAAGGTDFQNGLAGIRLYLESCVEVFQRTRTEMEQAKDSDRLRKCESIIMKIKRPNLQQRLLVLEGDEKDADKTSARLMTLHGAKGLEFDRVWILGCEEGVLPATTGDIEEERRLMYVGMTRAKFELHLSYVINLDFPPSRFLKECGLM